MQPAPIETIVAHAPGPWHAEAAPSASSMRSIRTEDGKAIAFVNRGPSAEANERLIVTAPELYEFVVRISTMQTRPDEPLSAYEWFQLQETAAVLANLAEGRS